MPFDSPYLLHDSPHLSQQKLVHAEVLRLLERGLSRVEAGYCWAFMYRKTWFLRRPKFCMSGALYLDNSGEWEDLGPNHYEAICLAESYLHRFTKGRTLVDYGTRPFVRGRVIRAYRQALQAAR